MQTDIIDTDILIIGAAIAGCRAAIEAHELGAKVLLTTKGVFGKDCGATWMGTLGYQTWGIHPNDTLDVHAEDTIRCGWFLNNQENVYAFLAHVPDTAMELKKWGGRYKMKDGHFLPRWQLGQSIEEGRSLEPESWPRGELGYTLSKVIPRAVKARKIGIIEDIFITDLLTTEDNVVGALGIDIRTGKFKVLRAKVTILATGGYLGLYNVTDASPMLTGDGQAIALRAGVDMMDFEFIQTLPAAVWPPTIAGLTIPFRLLFDFDGRMYNSKNERFLEKWDSVKMERSTRAVLSRGIYHEIKEGKGSPHGGVYTSIAHNSKSFIKSKIAEYGRNPFFEKLREAGIDLTKDSVETVYAIHYTQGGCNVNAKCETDKAGLYAIGEVTSGGKDGSDRMMSNALPYCMAMGIIAGRETAQRAKLAQTPKIDDLQVERLGKRALAPLERERGVRVFEVKPALQDIMTRETSYGRTGEGLKLALEQVKKYREDAAHNMYVANKSPRFNFEWINALEFDNMALVSECVIGNALLRTESRGLHDRWDYPDPDPDWFKNIHLRLMDGELKHWTTPVPFTYWEPEPRSLGEPWRKGVKVKEYRGWQARPLYERMGDKKRGSK